MLRDYKPITQTEIVGVRIPFFDLMWILVKISLASIPAAIILAIVYVMIIGVLTGIGMSFGAL